MLERYIVGARREMRNPGLPMPNLDAEPGRHTRRVTSGRSLSEGNLASRFKWSGNNADFTTICREMRNLLRRYPDFTDMRAALAVALWGLGLEGKAEVEW